VDRAIRPIRNLALRSTRERLDRKTLIDTMENGEFNLFGQTFHLKIKFLSSNSGKWPW